jgi:hypothetical protein
VINDLDFEGLADLQLCEILGISPQCDHTRVGPEQEGAAQRIDRQDLPVDSVGEPQRGCSRASRRSGRRRE